MAADIPPMRNIESSILAKPKEIRVYGVVMLERLSLIIKKSNTESDKKRTKM